MDIIQSSLFAGWRCGRLARPEHPGREMSGYRTSCTHSCFRHDILLTNVLVWRGSRFSICREVSCQPNPGADQDAGLRFEAHRRLLCVFLFPTPIGGTAHIHFSTSTHPGTKISTLEELFIFANCADPEHKIQWNIESKINASHPKALTHLWRNSMRNSRRVHTPSLKSS